MTSDLRFSPLAELKETSLYPLARTLRSTFPTKIKDTFKVFSGKSIDPKHLGIFDYATLFVPYGLNRSKKFFVEFINKKQSQSVWVLGASILLLTIGSIFEKAFNIARFIFSAVATLLLLPLIALVHGISRLIAKNDYNKALSLAGENEKGEKQSLATYLEQNRLEINELDIELDISGKKSYSESPSGNDYKLIVRPSDYKRPLSHCTIKLSSNESNAEKNQAANIHSLFKLNIGRVVNTIESIAITENDKKALLSIK